MGELHDVQAGAATGSTHPSIAALQKPLDLGIGVHVRVGFLSAPHGARALVPCTVYHVAADFSSALSSSAASVFMPCARAQFNRRQRCELKRSDNVFQHAVRQQGASLLLLPAFV